MDLNLDTLKREILEYLGASGFAVFRSSPGRPGRPAHGALGHREAIPITRCSWTSPEERRARSCSSPPRIRCHRHRRSAGATRRLRSRRAKSSATTSRACATCACYEGVTCSIELAFDLRLAPVRLRNAARLVRRIPEHRRRNRWCTSPAKTSRRRRRFAGRIFLQELTCGMPFGPLADSRSRRAAGRPAALARGAAHRPARRARAAGPSRLRATPRPPAVSCHPSLDDLHDPFAAARHAGSGRAPAPRHSRPARKS